MSVLKSLDIDLPQSEKRTLFNFLALYTFFTIVILAFSINSYYNFQKDLKMSEKRLILNQYANELAIELKNLYLKPLSQQIYPTNTKFQSTVYDVDGNIVFSTMKNPKAKIDQIVYSSDETIVYIEDPNSSYLGAAYVLVKIAEDKQWKQQIIYKISIYTIIASIIMFTVGYFLLKLFLKPMRDALHLLDSFIQDTTHELNTPISTIVANIEMIDTKKLEDKKLIQKIRRIDIGAKTIANIYDDLTYLILNNKIISENKPVIVDDLFTQRIEYFTTLANAKHIVITKHIQENVILNIDEKKLSKLIDNLLSNAIKYNKQKGHINILISNKYFTIEDTGCGISSDNIKLMFDRYARFNKSVGGFGIGLNIVKLICDEYNFQIKIDSTKDVGTTITIIFENYHIT